MTTRATTPQHPRARAFTVVELLAVIAVIAILATILLVVGASALQGSKNARALSQFRTIAQGIDTFRTDFTYLPPLLPATDDAGSPVTGAPTPSLLASATGQDQRDILQRNRYMSEHSLTVYLLGIGRLNDNADPDDRGDGGVTENDFSGDPPTSHDGVTGPGIKDPGRTRAWKDPALARDANDETDLQDAHQPVRSGRTYGPYLDLASLDDFLVYDEDRQLFEILDPWGAPIRYYRSWPIRDPNEPENRDRVSVAGVPVELWSPALFQRFVTLGGDNAALTSNDASTGQPELDPNLDRDLISARYALLSAGEDPQQYLDRDGDPILPFGDAVRSPSNGQRDEIEFNTASDTLDFTTIPSDARNDIQRFIQSNVRFTAR